MALIDGDEFVTGDFLSFQEGNRLKDHWVQADPQANLGSPQEGMIVYDSDDGKLYLRLAVAYTEIATALSPDGKVKVDAAAVAGYLGALFNDGVLRTAQDELTFVDGGDFVTLGLADHNTARTALGLAIGVDVLAQQAIGIADDNLLEVDDAGAADDEYCRFTANGIEGRVPVDVLADLSGQAGAPFAWNGQNLTGVGTIGLGGGQIAFPAAQSASADPNTLDDYEEGTFTAYIYDADSGGNQGGAGAGIYTKVGNMVSVNIFFSNVSTVGMTGANILYIRELPFTIKAGSDVMGALNVRRITINNDYLVAKAFANTTYCVFADTDSGTNGASTIVSALTSGQADFTFSLVYQV